MMAFGKTPSVGTMKAPSEMPRMSKPGAPSPPPQVGHTNNRTKARSSNAAPSITNRIGQATADADDDTSAGTR
jgi:hypothetical protein